LQVLGAMAFPLAWVLRQCGWEGAANYFLLQG
jgi:hypothetical protein